MDLNQPAFNSLTDSHILKKSQISVKQLISFQFPNGFSQQTDKEGSEQGVCFQFPNGFSLFLISVPQQRNKKAFNSLTDSHSLHNNIYYTANNISFNSLTDSHIAVVAFILFVNAYLIPFQFPNGFSLQNVGRQVLSLMLTFNSLTDSHTAYCISLLLLLFSFQFPNGFSQLIYWDIHILTLCFQFPNGFSPKEDYEVLKGLTIAFNSLTDSHSTHMPCGYGAMRIFQFPNGFSHIYKDVLYKYT